MALLIVVLGGLAAFGVVLWVLKPPEFRLADDTIVSITGVSSGKQLRIFHGPLWQKPGYLLLHRYFPAAFKNVSSVWPSSFTNGSLGVAFVHFPPIDALPANPKTSLMLAVPNPDGTDGWCKQRGTHFTTKTLDGKRRIVAEHILWELPPSTARELRLRLYSWNAQEKKAVFKEFRIPNPLAEAK